MRRPFVDIGQCTMCEGCLEVAPEVFELNPAGGYIEVKDLDQYPEESVREAMAICPAQCIDWQED